MQELSITGPDEMCYCIQMSWVIKSGKDDSVMVRNFLTRKLFKQDTIFINYCNIGGDYR